MFKKLFLFVFFCLLLMPYTVYAEIPDKPTNNIYIVDNANVISKSTKNELQALGQELKKDTGAQIVVVTIKNLDGQTIEEFSNSLFNNWGIGSKKDNNGILFLVAPNDRQMRLEIGSGLEGRIPDMIAGRIMDKQAKPFFRKNDYNQGISNTYKALVNEVRLEYNKDNSNNENNIAQDKENASNNSSLLDKFFALPIHLMLLVIFILLIILYLILRLGIFFFPGGGSGGSGGGFDDFFSGGGSSGGGSSDFFD